MIEELHAAEIKVKKHIDFWLNNILLCDNRTDRLKARKSIEWLYRFCKEELPIIIWLDSPYSCQIAANIVSTSLEKNDRVDVRNNILDSTEKFKENISKDISYNIFNTVNNTFKSSLNIVIRQLLYENIKDKVQEDIDINIQQAVKTYLEFTINKQVDLDIIQNTLSDVMAVVGKEINWNITTDLMYYNSWYSNGKTNYGWVSYSDYCISNKVTEIESKKDFDCYKQLYLSGVYEMIAFGKICIVSDMPITIYRDNDGKLHNTEGYAIAFKDGYGQYFINGRMMPGWIFNGFTKDQFIGEENADIKAGMYAIIESKGEGGMLTFLGAAKVHEQSFIHDTGDIEVMELYKTRERFWEEEDLNGNRNVPLCWLKLICPSTGATYLIPSDPSFNTCEEAAKYARPDYVSKELPYKWFSHS